MCGERESLEFISALLSHGRVVSGVLAGLASRGSYRDSYTRDRRKSRDGRGYKSRATASVKTLTVFRDHTICGGRLYPSRRIREVKNRPNCFGTTAWIPLLGLRCTRIGPRNYRSEGVLQLIKKARILQFLYHICRGCVCRTHLSIVFVIRIMHSPLHSSRFNDNLRKLHMCIVPRARENLF